jgi:hypothetical protein
MTQTVAPGSHWKDSQGRMFHVISVQDIEGHTWVYYHLDRSHGNENSDFSCYLESFLARFTPYANTR